MASFNSHQEQQMMMMNSSFDNNNNNNNNMVYYDYYNDGGDGEFFDLKPYSCDIFTPFSSTSSSSSCISDINGTNWSSQLQKKASFCSSSSGPQVISFGNSSNSLFGQSDDSDKFLLDDKMICNKPKPVTRSPVQAQYHVEAERKRREKLSELFISLSKIIPGLKKLDKATLLGDAIKYMKELQERVKMLEEETTKTNSMSISMEFDTNYSNNNGSNCCRRRDNNIPIHDVRVRVMNNNLLIKIHCEKQQIMMNGGSFVARITSELEKLNLSILDIRVIPFGCTILDITILAQMDREYPPTAVKDIIKHLQQITGIQDQTSLINSNNSFSEDYCFHHLSPLSGSEVWEDS